MTNQEILNIYDGIQELIRSKMPLNIKTSYILAKDKKILEPYVETIKEQQMLLYKKYGHEENGGIKVNNEDIPALQKDLKELLSINNTIGISKVAIQNLDDINIDIETLEKLIPIIDE